MGNTFDEILMKYYAYEVTGLRYQIVEFPQFEEILDAGRYILDFILTMDHVDKSLINTEEALMMGIACSCAPETVFRGGSEERNSICLIAVAQDVRQKLVTEHVPRYAPLLEDEDKCIETCDIPYQEYQTTYDCSEDEVISNLETCQTCEELVHHCILCTDWNNEDDEIGDSVDEYDYNNCYQCRQNLTFVITDEDQQV